MLQTETTMYQAMFNPASVAIVGASDDISKTTARPLKYLQESDWQGRVYPVNPVRDTVLGERSYPSVSSLPEVPDHVFVLAASDIAVGTVEECVALGVPVVTVMADGFVDSDPRGAERQSRLRRAVAGSHTRVIGPSSLGLANIGDHFILTANAAFAEVDIPQGGVFVASQSGSVIGAVMSRCKEMGIGLHSLISTGTEIDLSLGEICAATLDDPDITSYVLFLENLNSAHELRTFTEGAAQRGKAVSVYKLGRNDVAAQLSVSHTGALAGDDVVASAFFDDLGIARLTNFEALLEAQTLLATTKPRAHGHRSPRIAVVSTTGGGGAMMVDCLATAGAIPEPPSKETVERLAKIGIEHSGSVLIDLTLAGTRYEVMKAALDILTEAPEYDAIVAVPGSSARFHPEHAVAPIAESAGGAKPIVAFIVPAAEEALRLLRQAGVAAFRTPEACADAITATLNRKLPAMRPAVQASSASETRVLDEQASMRLLTQTGIQFAPASVMQVTELPDDLPVHGPVAVKVLSAQIPHKSDVGGVKLGIRNGIELAQAVAEIQESARIHVPDTKVESVLVQQMVQGVGEVLLGYRNDREVGPVVVLAAGGVLAELYQDRALRLAPVVQSEAHAMIKEVIALRALDGYRGLPKGDLDALADAIVAFSHLGEVSQDIVEEAEINPLIVLPPGQGVIAVDALTRVRQGADV